MTDKKRGKGGSTAGSGPGFEEALRRLEVIVGEMEDGTLSLDAMMARFEEGQKLIHQCTGRLNEVERKIETLLKDGDKLTVQPFEEAEEGNDADLPEEPDQDELFKGKA